MDIALGVIEMALNSALNKGDVQLFTDRPPKELTELEKQINIKINGVEQSTLNEAKDQFISAA